MNRRHFLKSAAVLALAAPATVKLLPAPAAQVATPMEYVVEWRCKDGIGMGTMTSPDKLQALYFFNQLLSEDKQYKNYKWVSLMKTASNEFGGFWELVDWHTDIPNFNLQSRHRRLA